MTALRTAGLLPLLLGIALPLRAAEPSLSPPTLEAVEAVLPLHHANPAMFRSAVRRLVEAPAPAEPLTAGLLRLAEARAEALAGRFDAALERARPLADGAADPRLRLRAAALMVDVHGAARRFMAGQQRLEPLLTEAEAQGDTALRRVARLAAAQFHAQLGQDEAALMHASAVIAAGAETLERCVATRLMVESRLDLDDDALAADDFDAGIALCDDANAPLPRAQLDLAKARWWLAKDRPRDASLLLAARWPALEALGMPRLLADGHIQRAEAWRRLGRLDEAEAEVSRALARSAALPTGLPLLRARRTAYAIALDRGDEARALGALQAVLVAERAYAEELQRLQRDYFAGRGDAAALHQASLLLEARNAQLALETEEARRFTRTVHLALVPVGLVLLAIVGWTLRTRAHRQHLEAQLRVDPMTGLATRTHFTQQTIEALARLEREHVPAALLLVDLDHFSLINNQHGHLAGDRLLIAIGACLKAVAGDTASFARMGGEEFAIVLPRCGIDAGLAFAERCREAVAGTIAGEGEGGGTLRTTASFGVTSTTVAGYRLRDLLASADTALYRAKHAGRNRVAAAAPAPTAAA